MLVRNWKLDFEKYKGLETKTPCSLYSVLLQYDLISHPYYQHDESEAFKLSEKDCVFYTEFEVGEKEYEKTSKVLRFSGLDTVCTIELNGVVLGDTKNFYRTYEFHCEELIKKGKNVLRLYFTSPVQYIQDKEAQEPLWSEVITMKGAAHLRKPIYSFGWDWAPCLPDMGIFGDIEFLAYDIRLLSLDCLQEHEDEQVTLSVQSTYEGEVSAQCKFSLWNGNELVSVCTTSNTCAKLVVKNPKLWWPRGYGEQNLYTLKVELFDGETKIDELSKQIGLRTLTVSTEEDIVGREFCFVVNGIKIFAMGADYVPEDGILPTINKERIEFWLREALDQNFNCIRIWGGGYYPKDVFYDFCDKHGLIVWLDYMTACEDVRLKDGGKEEYIAEFIENVNAVKHRACLGLICGNNEGEDKLKDRRQNQTAVKDYIQLYEKEFPAIMKEIAPQTFYWQSSPSNTGSFDKTNDPAYGDSHCWGVWFADKPSDYYKNELARFCSEFGYESFPSIKTIKTFAQAKELNPFSPTLEARERTGVFPGNEKIYRDIAKEYRCPYSFEEFIYLSQLEQVAAVETGVEHFRRHRGICMGSLYWQFNDCWPCVSHSAIDYFGRRKALHYHAKRFYAPIFLSVHQDGYSVVANISNETREHFEGTIEWQIVDNYFHVIQQDTKPVKVDKLSALDILQINVEKDISVVPNIRFLTVTVKDNDGNKISSKTALFVKSKHYDYAPAMVRYKIVKEGEYCCLKIKSETFVHSLFIEFNEADAQLSDNFFDITNIDEKQIYFQYDGDIEVLQNSIRFICLNDVGRKQNSQFIYIDNV